MLLQSFAAVKLALALSLAALSADGNDAEERMELAPDEARALTGAERLHAGVNLGRGRILGCCHQMCGS